jgi:hypothetical protein
MSIAAVDAGDILINDQKIDAIASTDDLEDIITNINTNVDNVTASGFNMVVAKQIGTGVTTNDQFKIAVTALGASTETVYAISASNNMDELADCLNRACATCDRKLSNPPLLNPSRLIKAWALGKRNMRGLGLPDCATGVTVPTSTNPKPMCCHASMQRAFLSKPAAKPIRLGNVSPHSCTGSLIFSCA